VFQALGSTSSGRGHHGPTLIRLLPWRARLLSQRRMGTPRPATFRSNRALAVTVGAAASSLEHVYESPGRSSFRGGRRGRPLVPEPVFNGREPGSLFALFVDRTSGVTNLSGHRRLRSTPPVGPPASLVLDFNRATDLCVQPTRLRHCPLKPAGRDRLPVAVRGAGREIPYDRLSTAALRPNRVCSLGQRILNGPSLSPR